MLLSRLGIQLFVLIIDSISSFSRFYNLHYISFPFLSFPFLSFPFLSIYLGKLKREIRELRKVKRDLLLSLKTKDDNNNNKKKQKKNNTNTTDQYKNHPMIPRSGIRIITTTGQEIYLLESISGNTYWFYLSISVPVLSSNLTSSVLSNLESRDGSRFVWKARTGEDLYVVKIVLGNNPRQAHITNEARILRDYLE